MATTIQTTNLIGAGTQVAVLANDRFWLQSGVVVASTNNNAVSGAAGSSIQIDGSVVGTNSAFLLDQSALTIGATGSATSFATAGGVGVFFTNAGCSLTNYGSVTANTANAVAMQGGSYVRNYGSIYGQDNGVLMGLFGATGDVLFNAGAISAGNRDVVSARFNHGVMVEGDNATITNSSTGSIVATSGSGSGVSVGTGTSLNGGNNTVIENHGLIQSQQFWGVDFFNMTALSTARLVNYGTISGQDGSFRGNESADAVINEGLMQGDVLMGDGDDVYDGTGGRVSGTVRGGNGADTLTGGAAGDALLGEAGNDLLRGAGGNDTLSGGAGLDLAFFDGLRASYTIVRAGGVVTVVAANGAEGTDVLTGIEKISFADSTVILKTVANDFDGDGKSDVLWRNTASGANTIWLGADNTLPQAVASLADQNFKVAGIGDFNADGQSDILWRNTTTGANTIWKSGNSAAVQAVATIADQAWKIMGTGDFDGDGKADILWRNTTTGANSIWKSGSNATVQAIAAIADQNWKIVGTGDFNGDERSDIVWRNTATGENTIWKSGSSGTVQTMGAITDQAWTVAGTGDFDGDAQSDILWRNTATGANTIWKSGSNGSVQAVATIADQNWKITGTGDYDGDGKSDILWRNTFTGAGTIWKSGSSATVQAVAPFADVNWAIVDGVESGDLLIGGAGNNTLYGTSRGDVFLGGAGSDTLTGGLGADVFRFLNAAHGNDTITDFLSGTDKLQLVSSEFGGLALGALAAGNLVSGAAPAANLASAQFLYNTSSGQVSFDADGTGIGAAVNLVTLVGSPTLSAADFLMVA